MNTFELPIRVSATVFVWDKDALRVDTMSNERWPVFLYGEGVTIYLDYETAIDLSRKLRIVAGIDEAPSAPNEAA